MRRVLQVVVSGLAVAAAMLVASPMASAQEPAAAPAAPVLTLEGDISLITILIKPDKTADFETVLNKLKEALAKSDKPGRKDQAASWTVYKSPTAGPQGTVVYYMLINPPVKGQEYDISRLIAEVFPVEVQELFAKYKDAFAGRAITPLNKFMTMQ